MNAARLSVSIEMPDGKVLSYLRMLDRLELDEITVCPEPQPPLGVGPGDIVALVHWQERRERGRRMARDIGESIAFALQQALLYGKAE